MVSASDLGGGRPAELRRVRTAALVDFATALLLAMVIFPFPVARATLSRPVFVTSILVSIVLVHLLYLAGALLVWGRTPGMYLLDIGLEGDPPGAGTSLAWALGASLALWPTVFSSALGDPVTGIPARLSGRRTVSTAIDSGNESEDG